MRAPDYDWGDLAYYAGLILGGGCVYYLTVFLGVKHHWVALIPAGLVGAGIGWQLEKAYRNRQKK